MTNFEPSYIKTFNKGLLKEKIKESLDIMNSCTLCPRKCKVDRLAGETGICKTGKKAWVSSYNPHFGEEAPLVGREGSGTIFFTHCNLMCIFCQNYEISHEGVGEEVSHEHLAKMMLVLQDLGCHNINFVTPSHVVPQILMALESAVKDGLNIPLIYNTGGYDRVETLKILDGVVDIYMPDFKFRNSEIAEATCKAGDYPDVARKAVAEMHRQVGDLITDEDGIARRGLLISHLVLPDGLAGTREIMRFIVREISPDTYVNIMPQYRPCGGVNETSEVLKDSEVFKALSRYPSKTEFETALQEAAEEGITRFDRHRRVFMIC